MASERAREREVHRYYQTWLEASFCGAAASPWATTMTTSPTTASPQPQRSHSDGSALRASDDKALIAFAQLGCLRLNAKRGIVTLISTSRQYILAEATKSLSLISDLGEENEDDELWFGNASIPRGQGMSEAVLDAPLYTAKGSNGRTHSAPAVVINDVTQDHRYKNHAIAGNGVSFYCGVPITTRSGFVIGVYNVTDDKPRDGISPVELVMMQDMAQIIMMHLDVVRNNLARFRGEKMVVGLGDFIHGKTLSQLVSSPQKSETLEKTSDPTNPSTLNEEPNLRKFKGLDITNANPDLLRRDESSTETVHSPISRQRDEPEKFERRTLGSKPSESTCDEDMKEVDFATSTPSKRRLGFRSANTTEPAPSQHLSSSAQLRNLFTRAAVILQKSMLADGVLFFDAVPTNRTKRSGTSEFEHRADDGSEKARKHDDSSDAHDFELSSDRSSGSEASHSTGATRPHHSESTRCQLLAYALDVSQTSSANVGSINKMTLSETSLRYFTKRYPKGKIFHYGDAGELTTSDPESSESQRQEKPAEGLEKKLRSKSFNHSTKAIANELIRMVPGARNVVWLPLWDFDQQRWLAGIFLWSRRPERLLTAQDDLVYLKAFGSTIMIEVSRINAQVADEMKTTFIANISHELRSPLHGILGSKEFLQDTTLDPFQSSLVSSIDTCARTLLDTLEHVLEHSRINQISSKRIKGSKQKQSGVSSGASIKSLHEEEGDFAVLFEETVEAINAGQTFHGADGGHKTGVLKPALVASKNDQEETIQTTQHTSNKSSSPVAITLDIERRQNWWSRTDPGAIRRIVMNILGNAIKYTDHGFIKISLTTSKPLAESDLKQQNVCISIQDTGRGMSPQFLENHAFTPFSQESQFSAGIGLGLSIVRRLVESMQGDIDLRSAKDSGTEMKIHLPVPILNTRPESRQESAKDNTLAKVQRKTQGMTLCMLTPGSDGEKDDDQMLVRKVVEDSIITLVKDWFGMHCTAAETMDGQTADFFAYAEPPSMEYLLRSHGQTRGKSEVPLIIMTFDIFETAYLAANGLERLTGLGRVIEVISQPCGPQKLARSLQRCFSRLEELAEHCEAVSPSEPESPSVADNNQSLFSPRDLASNNLFAKDHGSPPEMLDQQSPSLEVLASIRSTGTDQRGTRRKSTLSSNEGTPKIQRPILLVDDNDVNLRLLEAFMKKAKRPFATARDGQQAVEQYRAASNNSDTAFEHVLMDISMPVMDGIMATRLIRQHEIKIGITERAQIIALTGLAAASTQKEMLDAGADQYLAKPIKFKDLINYLK